MIGYTVKSGSQYDTTKRINSFTGTLTSYETGLLGCLTRINNTAFICMFVFSFNNIIITFSLQVEEVCYDTLTGAMSTTASTTSTSRVIANLDPLTYCCVTVRAFHPIASCSVEIHGPAIEACAQTMDVTPGAVQGLSLQAISPTALYATWNPPANYQRPGLRYTLTLSPGSSPVDVHDQTTQYFSGLQPSTSYTVNVSATSTMTGADAQAMASTLDLPPTPPTNPSLSASGTDLSFTWGAPTSSDPPVTGYAASLRCNDVDFNQMTSTTSHTFDIRSISGLAWCTAVVQAQNSAGNSRYSPQANIILPPGVPTKPTCFYNGNTASNASISFTVTYPFSLNQLRLEWQLSSTGTSDIGMEEFDSNVVFVTVDRDTFYTFSLRLCNENGCGDYCDDIRFSTETVGHF